MSLSVNNPSLVKVDASALDRTPVSPPNVGGDFNAQAAGLNPSSTRVHNDVSRLSPGEVMIPGAALTKLFDMLEMIFKAMREMMSGKNLMPATLPDSAPLPDVKPGVRNLPVSSDAAKQLNMPGAARLLGNKPADMPVKPDAGKPADRPVKPDADKRSDVQVKPDAGKQADVKVKADADKQADVQVKADADKQADVLVKPDAGKPVNVPDARRQQLTVPSPPAPRSDVTVTNDAKTNVHLSVNVNSCHCPDTKVSPDGGLMPRSTVTTTVIPTNKTDAQPGVTITVTPRDKTDAQPAVAPLPGVKPRPLPDTPTSPGAVEDQSASSNWRPKFRPIFKI